MHNSLVVTLKGRGACFPLPLCPVLAKVSHNLAKEAMKENMAEKQDWNPSLWSFHTSLCAYTVYKKRITFTFLSNCDLVFYHSKQISKLKTGNKFPALTFQKFLIFTSWE